MQFDVEIHREIEFLSVILHVLHDNIHTFTEYCGQNITRTRQASLSPVKWAGRVSLRVDFSENEIYPRENVTCSVARLDLAY